MAENSNIAKFEELLSEVKREGINSLLDFIRKSDFYTAPASTRFHLSEQGGLLKHSLHVYECLNAKVDAPIWKDVLKGVSRETILIVSLLHDLCKTYYYTTDFKNQKTYDADKVSAASSREVKHDAKGDYIWETVPCFTVDNKYPLGHGSKSVVFILQYMKLSMEEITAITYHMGAYCDSSQWTELGQAYEKYPLALALHQADMEATHILEVEDGKKS
ncbi:MAG: hypothetical protein IKO36_00195 [Bacteroidaceae bacterium]|nr:hypothetical protein [Bacteroidaceae bacterium]